MPAPWFDGLGHIVCVVVLDGVWPEGLLDAHTAMVMPLRLGRGLCVCCQYSVVWASARMMQLELPCKSWVPDSFFIQCWDGRSSVEAWFSTSCLTGE